MSERDTLLLLKDIEQSIQLVLSYTENFTLEQYKTDRKTKDAVERNFEIIGEAAGRLPEEFRMENNEVEWRIIKDFRNVIIHDYFGINDEIIWNAIQKHLPVLLSKITTLIKAIDKKK